MESMVKCICREVIVCLKMLGESEFIFLVEVNYQDQVYFFWVVVCCLYCFIVDFVVEVFYEWFVVMKLDFSFEDFDVFYNCKLEWYDELDNVSVLMCDKLWQVLFRMMWEVGLLVKDKIINVILLSFRLVELLCQNNFDEFFYFLVYEFDIRGMLV